MLRPSLLITAVLAGITIAVRPDSDPDYEKTTTTTTKHHGHWTKTTSTSVEARYGSTVIPTNTYNAVASEQLYSSALESPSIPQTGVNAPSSSVGSSRVPYSSGFSSIVIAPSSGVGSSKAPQSSGVSSIVIAPSSGIGSSRMPQSSGSGSLVTAPSSRASSSIVSLSGSISLSSAAVTSTTASVITVPGCDPITITSTYTYYTQTDVYGRTETTYYPVHETLSFTSSYTLTVTDYATITSYYTTTTSTVLEVSPASTTITVPTPPGFTPITCEQAYYAVTTTVTTPFYVLTTVVTITDTSLPTTTVTDESFEIADTFTTSLPQQPTETKYLMFTETTTTTRASPTQTIYDACQTNNITPKLPNGGYALFTYFGNNTTAIRYLASGPADCCTLCQANSSCIASQWQVYTPIFPIPSDQACTLFFKVSGLDTCDPTYLGIYAGPGTSDRDYRYLSNGRCGQWGFFQR